MNNHENTLVELKTGVYRHFKGGEYEVYGLSLHTETDETLVLYRSINRKNYADNGLEYARPYNLFFSKVDKEKYPDVKQESRFEYVGEYKLKEYPIGITPHYIWERTRLSDIKRAINRYEREGLKIPSEWYEELKELQKKYE